VCQLPGAIADPLRAAVAKRPLSFRPRGFSHLDGLLHTRCVRLEASSPAGVRRDAERPKPPLSQREHPRKTPSPIAVPHHCGLCPLLVPHFVTPPTRPGGDRRETRGSHRGDAEPKSDDSKRLPLEGATEEPASRICEHAPLGTSHDARRVSSRREAIRTSAPPRRRRTWRQTSLSPVHPRVQTAARGHRHRFRRHVQLGDAQIHEGSPRHLQTYRPPKRTDPSPDSAPLRRAALCQ
jgi:hypothetical protein